MRMFKKDQLRAWYYGQGLMDEVR